MKPLKIEKYSPSKTAKYDKAGEPYKLVSASGKEVRVIATDCGEKNDMIIVETVNLDKYGHKHSWYIKKNGHSQYGDREAVYIWRGELDIESGDLICIYHGQNRQFYFMAVFDHFNLENAEKGFVIRWEMDSTGHQLCLCCLLHPISQSDDEITIIRATEEQEAQYWRFMEANGYVSNDELGRLVELPKVGEKYYSVELENGTPLIVEHDVIKCEEDRPRGHLLCFTYKPRAEKVLKNILEATKNTNL